MVGLITHVLTRPEPVRHEPALPEPRSEVNPQISHPAVPDTDHPSYASWRLVQRAQAGDREAFGELYERYREQLYRFIFFRVGKRWVAEDLLSDTFVRAIKSIGGLAWQGRDPAAWLTTIARNLIADYFKSGRYRLEVVTGDVMDSTEEARGHEADPAASVADYLTSRQLLAVVQKLSPEQRECIVLRFLKGLSVAETARVMGKKEGATKALQYRAIRTLARILPEGFTP